MSLNFVAFVLVLLFPIAASQSPREQYFVHEDTGGQLKLLVTTRNNGHDNGLSNCEVITDKTYINNVFKRSFEIYLRKVDSHQFQQLLQECDAFEQLRSKNTKDRLIDTTTINPMEAPANGETIIEGYAGWHVIFPGTKWCGAGDIAKNYNDLGSHSDTDKCCRAHDLCDDIMASGETKNNITNSSPFTKLSCECDDAFYNCLDHVDSIISNKIGNLYFNILRRDCYKIDYPFSKKCKSFRSFLKVTCKEYERDTKASERYQWVKPKLYKKLPMIGPLTITLPF